MNDDDDDVKYTPYLHNRSYSFTDPSHYHSIDVQNNYQQTLKQFSIFSNDHKVVSRFRIASQKKETKDL